MCLTRYKKFDMLHGMLKTVTNHEYIKNRRKELGFSQKEMAAKAGLSAALWSYIETGKRNIRTDYIPSVADALNVGIDKLFISNN